MREESAPRSEPRQPRDNGRQYRVNTNRGQARKRIRYVESGGTAPTANQCPLCQDQLA